MNKENNWLFFEILILLILLLLIVGGGGYCIFYSSNLNEYIEGNLYFTEFFLMTHEFKEENNNKNHLHNFCFYYDFTKNEGNISFDLDRQNWSLSYIKITFPSIINNIDYFSIKNGIKTDFEANITIKELRSGLSEINYSNLTISNISRVFNDEKFVIEFESNLKPNGNFIFFYNNLYNVLSSSVKSML